MDFSFRDRASIDKPEFYYRALHLAARMADRRPLAELIRQAGIRPPPGRYSDPCNVTTWAPGARHPAPAPGA
ncbi:hypothetical protein GCM10025867_29980 [Frondihabitans sucicola]|uniref:Uncharacterized protein n=1 Tax=Frondihabitans sucicola TaxID=1268041 RepID=A0ABN6Y093_9MICO|nr:hypothetical protein GCM10025867_29980 [Frondihabitans sucicola]